MSVLQDSSPGEGSTELGLAKTPSRAGVCDKSGYGGYLEVWNGLGLSPGCNTHCRRSRDSKLRYEMCLAGGRAEMTMRSVTGLSVNESWPERSRNMVLNRYQRFENCDVRGGKAFMSRIQDLPRASWRSPDYCS